LEFLNYKPDGSPEFTLEYPAYPVSGSDQKSGYLLITVHEDKGTCDAVGKVLITVDNTWVAGYTRQTPVMRESKEVRYVPVS